MMTRKVYIAVARILKEAKDSDANAYNEGEAMRKEIADKLGDLFADDNPDFDWNRFKEATEV